MKFSLEACCVIVSTNLTDGKITILSVDNSKFTPPTLSIDEENIRNIRDTLVAYITGFLSIEPVYVVPQLISIEKRKEREELDTLSLIYGFLIPEQTSADNGYWLEFNYTNPQTEYANIVAEVIQKLK